jgi:ABC-type transport system involved in multi-copper enzyme maturation permease subunit
MSTVVERNVDYGYGSVRSRISWGAIVAGAAVAMAIYALLMALGVAVGMSVSDDVNARTLGTGAGVWGFISLLVALFAGGWVTTQVTVGESRTEAILYGVVLWATTSVLLLWLTVNGVRAGLDTAAASRSLSGANQTAASADAGQSPEERQAAIERAREAGKEGSWWAFAGMLISMVAAIGGALVGPVELTVRRDTRRFREQQTPIT